MGVPWGCDRICVEISRVSVAGVGGTVCRGQGVSVHHDLSCLICVHAGRGCCHGGGLYESSTTPSAVAPSRGLLGALRFGPACSSCAGGQHGHQYHKESGQEDWANGGHTEGLTQKSVREKSGSLKNMNKTGAAL